MSLSIGSHDELQRHDRPGFPRVDATLLLPCYLVTCTLSTCSLPREGQDRIPGRCVPNQFLAACYNGLNGMEQPKGEWACSGLVLGNASLMSLT